MYHSKSFHSAVCNNAKKAIFSPSGYIKYLVTVHLSYKVYSFLEKNNFEFEINEIDELKRLFHI